MTMAPDNACADEVRVENLKRKSIDQSALKLLARRGAWVSTNEAPQRGVVVINAPSARDELDIRQLNLADWTRWVSSGWVVPDEGSDVKDRWRLANAGRINLKRLLSRIPNEAGQVIPIDNRTSQTVPEIAQNDAESPLAWLRRRRDSLGNPFLSDAEYMAGERLRSDFWFAKMTPRVTANWSPVSAGRARRHGGGINRESDQQEAISDAAERVRSALRAVGPELSGVLIDVCCHLKGMEKVEKGENWPQRAGRVVLQHALRALGRHYGLIRCAEVPDLFADDPC
ncbi:MAG: DUF6456 domain-containing protein [Hyphomicrobiaceae bacterium]